MTSDSGRLPEGENSRSEVECEASHSGGAAASPEHRSSPSIDEELIEARFYKLLAYDCGDESNHCIDLAVTSAAFVESLLSDRAKLEERVRLLEALISEQSIERLAEDIAIACVDCLPHIRVPRHSAMVRLGERLRNPLASDIKWLNRSTDR